MAVPDVGKTGVDRTQAITLPIDKSRTLLDNFFCGPPFFIVDCCPIFRQQIPTIVPLPNSFQSCRDPPRLKQPFSSTSFVLCLISHAMAFLSLSSVLLSFLVIGPLVYSRLPLNLQLCHSFPLAAVCLYQQLTVHETFRHCTLSPYFFF